jgi:hypothetical protein
LLVVVALVLSATGLVVGLLALRAARDAKHHPSYAEAVAEAFDSIDTGMTPQEVVNRIGFPREILRRCWTYESAYTIKVCFGPRRRVATIAKSTPPPPPINNWPLGSVARGRPGGIEAQSSRR